MFDDPKRELQRLEEELLAEEAEENPDQEEEPAPEDEFDPFFDDDALNDALYGSDQGWLEDVDALLQEPEVRNHANGYGTRRSNPAVDFPKTVYADEDLDESQAVFDDRPKPKGVGGLVFLAILEVIGILAVLLWWVQWLG